MTTYYTPLRRTFKWYKKLGFEYILGMSMTNSLLLYKDTKGIGWRKSTDQSATKPEEFQTMLQFRESIIRSLCKMATPVRQSRTTRRTSVEQASRAMPPLDRHHIVALDDKKNNRVKTFMCSSPEQGPCWRRKALADD